MDEGKTERLARLGAIQETQARIAHLRQSIIGDAAAARSALFQIGGNVDEVYADMARDLCTRIAAAKTELAEAEARLAQLQGAVG